MAVAERVRGLIALIVLCALVCLGGASAWAQEPPASGQARAATIDAAPVPVARTLELSDDPQRMRLIWRPASVAWPLVPLGSGAGEYAQLAARLEQREAMLAGEVRAPSVRGPVDIDSERAVGVWIAALETVRVRQLGPAVPLRFVRGVDSRAAVLEPGREVAAGPGGERRFELHQPPSVGAVWSIEADEPTRVIVERVDARSPRYASVEVEQDLLRWIDADRGREDMPTLLEPADDLARRIELDAALADELERLASGDARLRDAAQAWRMLVTMLELDRTRPAVRPYFVRDVERQRPLRLDGTEPVRLATADSRDYRLARKPRRWIVSRKGAGQLRISARAWAPAGQELAPAYLLLYAGGRVIERVELSERQARRSVDPDTALPELEPMVTEAGDPVGEFVRSIVAVAPGRRDYEIELVGGPALLSIEGARRVEASLLSLRGWTPRKRARAAARSLAKAKAADARWLELLLAHALQEPLPFTPSADEFERLAARSPVLAVALLDLVAADRHVDAAAMDAHVAQVRPWLAALARDPSVAPEVRGVLRARWLRLIAAHGRPGHVNAIVERVPGGADPIVELPVEGLRLLAELMQPTSSTIRSPTLAVLELARSRAPEDEGLREQTLRLWAQASRWSRRRPLPRADLAPTERFGPAGEWLVARTTEDLELLEREDPWLRLELGEAVGVLARLGPAPVRRDLDDPVAANASARKRLLDVHVATPLGAREPAALGVDGERWISPQIEDVQRLRVIVDEGVHELTVDGPPGTIAWVDAPPADVEHAREDPNLSGRRERMWPLARSSWRIPGPAVPGVIRLDLRWPEDVAPRPTRITMQQVGDFDPGTTPAERTVIFDPRTAAHAGQADAETDPAGAPDHRAIMDIDWGALPVGRSVWASPRHEVNLAIAAATTELRFAVEGDLEIAASVSVRRGLRPDDLDDPGDAALAQFGAAPAFDDVFGGLTALDGEGMLRELAGLSRLLLLAPDDLDHRARRAVLLLMLGETGHARADLLRLATWADRSSGDGIQRARADALLSELEQRFDALIEPREIVVDAGAGFDRPEPILVEPALAAFVGDDRDRVEPWLDRWARARGAPLDEALATLALELGGATSALAEARARGDDADFAALADDLLFAELTRATLMRLDPLRAREAGRAWLELYGRATTGHPGAVREPLAVGLAAVEPLLEHLDDPSSDARDAGLAYGLARALEPAYGHTSVRRLAFVAALRSDWSRIDHSEDNAGFERLELPVTEVEPSPTARVREALMVSPWPTDESREHLRPGRKGVLAWDAEPGTVRAELYCRALRPDLAPARADLAATPGGLGRARLNLRLRSSGASPVDLRASVEVDDATTGHVELPIAEAGRHQLEVVLDDDPVWHCQWRTRTAARGAAAEAGEVVESRRRAMWFTSEANRAVEFVVLGPTSLLIETRAVTSAKLDASPTALIASVERIEPEPGPARPEQGALAIDSERERAVITETLRRFDVAHASANTLLLTEAGPYRVRLRTDRGRALIRARVRRDRGDIPPPAQISVREYEPQYERSVGSFDWRSVGPIVDVLARDEIAPVRNRWGSLDLRADVGLDDLANVDDFEPRLGVHARVGWRREMLEDALWLHVAAQAAVRARSPVAGGGIVHVGARVPGIGARLGATLDVMAHAFAGRGETSVRIYGFVDRPIRVGRYAQLRPGLTAGVRWQSLNAARVDAAGGLLEPHPMVYQTYIENHPILARPELELRAFPLQDLALWTQASLTPNLNADPQPIDHVNVELGAVGIGRAPQAWVPTWGLSYRLSTRFADAHRMDMLLRHRVEAELGAGVWVRDAARISFGLRNQLYLSTGTTPVRDILELWLRVDAVWGRRLRDYGPSELWFREPWAPRAWGDDEHQAPSTQSEPRRGRRR